MGVAAFKEVSLLRARGVDARLLAPQMVENGMGSAERSFVERLPTMLRMGNASIMLGVRDACRGADVVHLHYPFFGTAEPLLLRQEAHDPPIVVTYHMDASASGIKGASFRMHRLMLQHAMLSRASRVIVSSLDYALHASLGSFFAQHANRVTELPFGVDADIFAPGASEKKRYDIPPDAPVVGFVGGLDRAHAFKGLTTLLEAWPRLDATTFLLVVGDGDLRPRFETLARNIGIGPHVRFTGRLPAEELPRAYRSMDAFAFPSTNAAEAFGLAALEAQASGVPVVASDLPGLRTVVIHGESGWLVPPNRPEALAAALMTILTDPGRRAQMAQRARGQALTFSWDRHVDGLLKVYHELCASRS